MRIARTSGSIASLLCIALLGCHHAAKPQAAIKAVAFPATAPTRPLVLHVPGVSGESFVDHNLRKGIIQGFTQRGIKPEFVIFDWTEHDPGIPALQAYKQNHVEAQKIADLIAKKASEDPSRRIYVTSHSGGAGLMAWALEDLSRGVQVESVLFLAPALSPGYDLSKALSHVRNKAYVFWSKYDTIVLDVGTTTFGTIDGLYCAAAGCVGFSEPATADKKQYAKLKQYPYDPAWTKYWNSGDHIGPTETDFAREVLTPTLLGEKP
jgi:hypothetical protein